MNDTDVRFHLLHTYMKSSVKCEKKSSFGLKARVVLYWMLAECVLDYAVVSGLVMEQSGQGSFML